MAITFLLLGKTNVAFYDATARERISNETPSSGALGAVEDIGSALGVIEAGPEAIWSLDVSVNEDHSLDADVTSFPVETGVDITDHVRLRPRVLSITGVVTDTPSGIEAIAVVPGLLDRFATLPRSIEIFQTIEREWLNKKLFDVVTAIKVYQNMAITSVRIPRQAVGGRGLAFNFTLREVQLVSSLIRPQGSLDGGGGDVNLGSVVGSVVQ